LLHNIVIYVIAILKKRIYRTEPKLKTEMRQLKNWKEDEKQQQSQKNNKENKIRRDKKEKRKKKQTLNSENIKIKYVVPLESEEKKNNELNDYFFRIV
jgi:hypothetical protein